MAGRIDLANRASAEFLRSQGITPLHRKRPTHPYRRLDELLPFNWMPPTDSYTL